MAMKGKLPERSKFVFYAATLRWTFIFHLDSPAHFLPKAISTDLGV